MSGKKMVKLLNHQKEHTLMIIKRTNYIKYCVPMAKSKRKNTTLKNGACFTEEGIIILNFIIHTHLRNSWKKIDQRKNAQK